MIRAKIIGAGGYGGVGISELLLKHPGAQIGALVDVENVGKPISEAAVKSVLKRWLPGPPDTVAQSAGRVPAVDFARLQDLFGDDDAAIQELLEVFVTTTAPLLSRLQNAIEQQGFDDIRVLGHQIAGSASNLGIQQLQQHATALEKAAMASDIGQAAALHASMQQTFCELSENVRRGLKSWMS